MLSELHSSKVAELVQMLDEAVGLECVEARCKRVKEVLEGMFESGDEVLRPEQLNPVLDHYARRLLHRDPQRRYSVVAMVWDVGQGTPLHDHAGEWCVECVYRGKIEVTSYALVGDLDDPTVQFRQERTIYAGVGEAGALIPPFDYHTIKNALTDRPSVTIHVYGHELTWCHIFAPVDGGFRRVQKELGYDS